MSSCLTNIAAKSHEMRIAHFVHLIDQELEIWRVVGDLLAWPVKTVLVSRLRYQDRENVCMGEGRENTHRYVHMHVSWGQNY